MGAYLTHPVTDKQSESGKNPRLLYGATQMQGWRTGQEDAHNCILNLEDNVSLFGVYDGHGGPEVSAYTAKHFPDFLKNSSLWKERLFGKALETSFLEFDKHLLSEEAVKELRVLAGKPEEDLSGEDEVVEDKGRLLEEAKIPLDELLRRYGIEYRPGTESPGEDSSQSSASSALLSRFLSPSLKRGGKGARKETEKTNGALPTLDLEQEEGPKTPPSSPNHVPGEADPPSSPEKKAVKRKQEDIPEEAILGDIGEREEPVEAKRMKNHASVHMETNGNHKESSQEVKQEMKRSSSEVDVRKGGEAGSARSSASWSYPSDIDFDSSSQSEHEERREESVIMVSRTRSSKSESEVNLLKMEEEESQGPINNWKAMGQLGKTDGDLQTSRVTGTPETATAASSSDEEEAGDADFQMEEDTKGKGHNSRHKSPAQDQEDLDSSSSRDDKSDSSSTSEEGESMEEEDWDSGLATAYSGFNSPSRINDKPGVDSGTTACVAVVSGETLYVGNAGDSRCVLSREGKAKDLSVDHKPEDPEELSRIIKANGHVTGDGRVNGGLNLSRALGDHLYKDNDSLPLTDQMISPLPDVVVETLTPADHFMVLACDGIWNSMSSQEVVDFVKDHMSKGTAVEKICEEAWEGSVVMFQLCKECLAGDTDGDGTGCDNMTVIIVSFKHPGMEEKPVDTAELNQGGSPKVRTAR